MQAQNFRNRVSQYTKVNQLPTNGINEQWVVKHAFTGKKYELKSVAVNDPLEYNLMVNELKVR